ncbi:hypothetical protein M426DRAFT_6927 [Hypoxylon sp. CI-4A]|nr:hypothetical protein M426DRAFT_6927 [Hypoxylon sp. CI-4A]
MPPTSRHGYGITLHGSSYRPLLDKLGLDGWIFRVDSSSFRAHREKQKLLREGLDVQWGNVLERSFSPDTPPDVLPCVAFNGKLRVERTLFDSVYAPAMRSTNVIETTRGDIVLHVSVYEQREDSVSVGWIYSRLAKGPTDPLHKPNRPVSGATSIPDEFFQRGRGSQGARPTIPDVFDTEKLRLERVLHWLMRTVLVNQQELHALAEKGVFFIGDSIHAEPILGGEGSCNATTDGISLAECISTQGLDGIPAWYNSRYPEWENGIRKSNNAIAKMHDSQNVSL